MKGFQAIVLVMPFMLQPAQAQNVLLNPSGTQTVNQPSPTQPLIVNYFNASVSNQVVKADQFPGIDGGAQIIAAIAALPATGGVVDARGLLTDAQNMAGSVFISENLDNPAGSTLPISKPVTILFGAANYIFSTPQIYKSNDFVLRGMGSSGGTVFEFSTSLAGADVFDIPTGTFRVSITNLLIKPASPGTHVTAVIDSEGYYGVFSQLELDDPWNGIFVSNGEHNLIEHVYILTTVASTLNYGVMLYGNDNDTFINDLWGVSAYAIGDSFLHVRNRASGVRVTDLSWQSNGGGGIGVLLDCGSSPTVAVACMDHYGPSSTDRPEFIKFVNTFTEGDDLTDGIVIKGGRDIEFVNTYVATSVHAVNISGESNEIVFDDLFTTAILDQCILDSAQSAAGVGYVSVTITNSQIGSCSGSSNRTYPAIELASGATDVNISNNRIGHSETNASADALYGVQLDGSNQNVLVRGNNFTSQNGGSQYLAGPINVLGGSPANTDVFTDNVPVTNTTGYTMILNQIPGMQNFTGGVTISQNLGSTGRVFTAGSSQSMGIGWNATGGSGEADIYSSYIGGWTASFYKNVTAGAAYSLEAYYDGAGNEFLAGGLNINSIASQGPSWNAGSAAPAGTCVSGSLYSNTGGSLTTTLYVCVATSWHAVTIP